MVRISTKGQQSTDLEGEGFFIQQNPRGKSWGSFLVGVRPRENPENVLGG